MEKILHWKKLIFSIIFVQLAGFAGSVFTLQSVSTWYPTLKKPFFNPPSWVFGPVWTILYLLMGISFYLVWKEKPSEKRSFAIWIFFLQLLLNVIWSIVFFGVQNPMAAFWEILILIFVILLNIWAFLRVSRLATWLLLPYLFWVLFAAFLNYSIWQLNI